MNEPEYFELRGEGRDCIILVLAEVQGFPDAIGHWGGYDVDAIVKIAAGDFQVKSKFYTSTGEIQSFFSQLLLCNDSLHGNAAFTSYEENLAFVVRYDISGQVLITGKFRSNDQRANELRFEIQSDQTFIQSTVKQLQSLAAKYAV
jgi:hypothetical protein